MSFIVEALFIEEGFTSFKFGVEGYALFHAGKYYQVRDVDGFLRKMRENADFREALIEQLKEYCYAAGKVDELVNGGYLEVTGEPVKEFPEEWEKIEIVEKEEV